MEQQDRRPLTRREAIKRGAAFGAGVVWAVPTVQVVGMSRAFANATSPDTGLIYYAIKIEQLKDAAGNIVVDANGDIVADCENIENQDKDQNPGQGQCFTPADFPEPISGGGCDRVDKTTNPPVVNDDANWVVTLKPGCEFVDNQSFVYIKDGNGCFQTTPQLVGGSWVFFRGSKDISHVEGIICCNPNGNG